MVSVHYTGSYHETEEEFETSHTVGQPFSFTIGEGGVLEGWDIAVRTMKKSEKCVVILSPEYAYGSKVSWVGLFNVGGHLTRNPG
jgi:FKBP-type peptidyl-prolyl cis-trans isomerase